MPVSDLPPELLDRVFDHCYGDKKSLERCTRVCRGWTSVSRYHLFSSITIRRRNIASCIAMLEVENFSSMVRPLVKRLELEVGEHILDFAQAMPKLASHLAPRSLEIYINNEAEDAESFDWDLERPPRVREDQSAFLGCFPTISSLELSITCATFLEVIDLITSFPLLEDLKLSATWEDDSETLPDGSFFPNRIRSLSLMPLRSFFLEWFLQHRPLQTPSSLNLRLHDDFRIHGLLIRQAGSCLTHLELNSISRGLLSEHINLEENPNLRFLRITVWESAVRIVLRLLMQIPGDVTVVEEVDFQAWEAGNGDAEIDRLWEELDVLLAGPRFPKIRRITVGVLKPHSSAVRQKLRRLDSRKILWLKDQSGNILT